MEKSRLRRHTPAEIEASFRLHFGSKARVFRAPGRVNLIGEHTDYNQGFVLPAAVNLSCWVAAAPREDRRFSIYAENFSEGAEVELDAIDCGPKKGWASYPCGVAWSLEHAGYRLRGCNLFIQGEVPLGSGLSSSAAMEVATAMALLETSGLSPDRNEVSELCKRAENEYVGARCGIMDQFIACYGRAGHALLLDCRSLQWRPIRLPQTVALVVCNTMVKHDLAANEYNRRRAECEEGVGRLKKALPSIVALRDVTVDQLEDHRNLLPGRVYKRCRHVLTENERVLNVATALERGAINPLSIGMAESHASLRDDYEVSCHELDLLVEIATSQTGVVGARMMGGGFGGCTINLVERRSVEAVVFEITKEYQKKTGRRPETYCLEAAQGAEAMELS
jgi:galactokinase